MLKDNNGKIVSLENNDPGKNNSRRYKLARHGMWLITVISIAATGTMSYMAFENPETVAWGSLISAVSLAIGSVLTTFYTSGFGDRKLMVDTNKSDE